jgi:hydrogenase expression/formation protein HypC
MCLGIPGEIVDLRDDGGLRIGRVRFAGITRDVCLDYVPDAAVGEYVLVHVGFAISKINPEEAARTYRVLEELGQTGELTADRKQGEAPS